MLNFHDEEYDTPDDSARTVARRFLRLIFCFVRDTFFAFVQYCRQFFTSRTQLIPQNAGKAMYETLHNGESLFQVYSEKWLFFATLRTFLLIFFLGGIIFSLNTFVENAITSTKEKVYISIYFNRDVEKEFIFAIRDTVLAERSDVVSHAVYVTREEALAQYLAFAGNDPSVVNALDILGGNPFHDAINISTFDTRDYESINTFFEQSYTDLVYGTSFERSKKSFDALRERVMFIRRITLFASLFFMFLAALVTYHSVRTGVAIHFRQLETVRPIGVQVQNEQTGRGQSILFGFLGALAVLVILFVLLFATNPFARSLLFVRGDDDGLAFSHWLVIFSGIGIFLTIVVVGIFAFRRKLRLQRQLQSL